MSDMHELTPDVAKELAAKLASLQGSRTDAEMGTLLGVTRTQWSYIRSSRRKMSYAVMKRAVSKWPELYPIVLRDLAAEPAEVA